MIFSIRSVV